MSRNDLWFIAILAVLGMAMLLGSDYNCPFEHMRCYR